MVEYVGTARPPSRAGSRGAGAEAGIRALVRRLDWVLLSTTLALAGYGLWAIAAITRHDVPGDEDYFLFRQAAYVAMGAVLLVGAILVDPVHYRRFRRPLYGALIAFLLVVLVAGIEARGSQRWLDAGFFRFQPSELGKVLLILAVAAFLADRGKRVAEGRTVGAAVGLAFLPTLLVFLQPDIGTSLVYGAALAAVLFFAGGLWRHLALLVTIGVAITATLLWLAPAAGVEVLKPYQADRLTAFTNPSNDPSGAGYNVTQSKTAVGAGGMRGRGPEGATQTRLNYLPEHETDFVFASLAEQRGFVGVSTLLLLYMLLLWRGLKVIAVARDAFSATVAGGIVFALLFQIAVNVGMTLGMAPITGIPLPFVSAGGSAMVTNLFAVGVLLAIAARGRKPFRI